MYLNNLILISSRLAREGLADFAGRELETSKNTKISHFVGLRREPFAAYPAACYSCFGWTSERLPRHDASW
jgi:hypothetical protein